MIKNSDMNISEIAYDSGFGSIRNFNRAFMEVYNITPTKYRKSF
jgi:AraC-like DNA-binding protein